MNRFFQEVRGWSGYFLDRLNLMVDNPHSYTKFKVIDRLRRQLGARTFIEAGTYHGVTADRCARVFEKVYTIELDKVLAERAMAYLKPRRNVIVLQGDATSVLPRLLGDPSIKEVLLFLDGHFCGSGTGCGQLPEPAVEQLEKISRYRDKVKAIVVDDLRSFGREPGFPPLSSLIREAENHFTKHGFLLKVQSDLLILKRQF